MELAEIISELRSRVDRTTGTNKGLLLTAIRNLETVNRDIPVLRGYPRYIEEPYMSCSECQPGRPCYGHGHH